MHSQHALSILPEVIVWPHMMMVYLNLRWEIRSAMVDSRALPNVERRGVG
jgi:hypothetical protein